MPLGTAIAIQVLAHNFFRATDKPRYSSHLNQWWKPVIGYQVMNVGTQFWRMITQVLTELRFVTITEGVQGHSMVAIPIYSLLSQTSGRLAFNILSTKEYTCITVHFKIQKNDSLS